MHSQALAGQLHALTLSFFTPRDHTVLRDFLRDLPRVYNRGGALRLSYEYIEWLRTSDADRDFSQRALFFSAMAQNEQLIALCLPQPVSMECLSPDAIDRQFMQRHLPVALLLRQFKCMLQDDLPVLTAVVKFGERAR